ncbi:hypothetical protein LEP1GSC066_4188 [Leptospira sp. serovar Kenya str. Sh9]|nr:hypothetical protein LEP1GSC066_4188 [Leptospira sp. serovar Kenya str. Sh9]
MFFQGITNSYSFMKTFFLLVCSNLFMTFAWYDHLKFFHG